MLHNIESVELDDPFSDMEISIAVPPEVEVELPQLSPDAPERPIAPEQDDSYGRVCGANKCQIASVILFTGAVGFYTYLQRSESTSVFMGMTLLLVGCIIKQCIPSNNVNESYRWCRP